MKLTRISSTYAVLCGILLSCSSLVARAESIKEADYPLCSNSRFRPCVCAASVPKGIAYRPSLPQCGGNAAIVLSGAFINSFSVVVRDQENRDRWPAGTNFGGCNAFQRDVLALNRCSAFKSQKRIRTKNKRGRPIRIECLGAPGNSALFRDVNRITIKISNRPLNIFRACLADNNKSQN